VPEGQAPQPSAVARALACSSPCARALAPAGAAPREAEMVAANLAPGGERGERNTPSGTWSLLDLYPGRAPAIGLVARALRKFDPTRGYKLLPLRLLVGFARDHPGRLREEPHDPAVDHITETLNKAQESQR